MWQRGYCSTYGGHLCVGCWYTLNSTFPPTFLAGTLLNSTHAMCPSPNDTLYEGYDHIYVEFTELYRPSGVLPGFYYLNERKYPPGFSIPPPAGLDSPATANKPISDQPINYPRLPVGATSPRELSPKLDELLPNESSTLLLGLHNWLLVGIFMAIMQYWSHP